MGRWSSLLSGLPKAQLEGLKHISGLIAEGADTFLMAEYRWPARGRRAVRGIHSFGAVSDRCALFSCGVTRFFGVVSDRCAFSFLGVTHSLMLFQTTGTKEMSHSG